MELFLSLSILVLVGALIFARTQPMIDHYQKLSQASALASELALSKALSSAANAEVLFEIIQTNDGIECIRKCDEPLKVKGMIGKKRRFQKLNLKTQKKIEISYFPTGVIYLNKEPIDPESQTQCWVLGREKTSNLVSY